MDGVDAAERGAGRRRTGSLRRDLVATWEVLIRPAPAFASLRDRGPVLAPWLVASALSAVLTLLLLSVSQRAAAHLTANLDSPALIHEVQESLGRMKLVSVGLAPLALLARWCLTALVLWAAAVLGTGAPTYRAVLSVVAYSALPGVLGKGLDLAVAWIDGPEFTTDLTPVLSSATSLGALLPGVHGTWTAALLDHLTLFGLWGLALWIVGLKEGLRMGWRRSATVAVPVWVLLVVSGAAADVLGRSLVGSVAGSG